MEPPPRSLDALPADLLRHIASHFPVHPRLRVLAVLCKRWRSIVFSSLPAFPPFPLSSAEAFARIAYLAPPDVRTLHHPFGHVHHIQCPCAQLPQFASLTSLHVTLGPHLADVDLARRTASSLTSLNVKIDKFVHPDVARLFGQLTLPRLTRLSLDAKGGFIHSASFLRAHASSLVSLSISGLWSQPPPLPACRELALHLPEAAALAEWLPRVAHTLTSLSLDAQHSIRVPETLLPLLLRTTTAVSIDFFEALPSSCPFLLLTSLKSVALRSEGSSYVSRAKLARFTACVNSCTHLSLGTPELFASLIHSNLTSLTLSRYATLLNATHRLSLPSLRTLTVTDAHVPLAYFVSSFPLTRLPALRTLAFCARRTFNKRRLYTAFLRRLEAAGGEQVTLGCTAHPNRRRDGREFVWLRVAYTGVSTADE